MQTYKFENGSFKLLSEAEKRQFFEFAESLKSKHSLNLAKLVRDSKAIRHLGIEPIASEPSPAIEKKD